MQLRVRSITYLAEGINGYELVDPRGRDLPRFEAGAHLELRVAGFLRQYSLCNNPAERRRYCIAVQRETDGRGGSLYLHDAVRVGGLLETSLPRNDFSLDPAAERHLLIAGGIGIAPIMAMISDLQRRGAEYEIHYCARSPAQAAFRKELTALVAEGRLSFHYDNGIPERGLDVAALLRWHRAGTHLYYCGPPPLMAAIAQAAGEWPAEAVHSESFAAVPDRAVNSEQPFRVRLVRSGREYQIPPGATIVEVLRREGVPVRTSCELGYCGACLTPYLAGEPDHRDQVLEENGRQRYLLICCSRSKTPVLELDL